MKVTLYSNDCPRCRVLKKKLDAKKVEYSIESSQDKMAELGLTVLPALAMSGDDSGTVMMTFEQAIKWVNALAGEETEEEPVPHFCATCRLDPDSDRR